MDASFGARLRAQRERQQITLETIAERTKIRQALFEALERDDVSRWPGGLFRRSYLRSYAVAIGLDPEPAVREFLTLYPEPVDAPPADALADPESSPTGRGPKTRLHYLLASAIDAVSKPFEERLDSLASTVAPAAIAADYGRADAAVATSDAIASETVPDIVNEIVNDFDSDALDGELDLESEPELEASDVGRDEGPAVQVDLAALAQLCSRITEAEKASDLEALLGEAAEILHAVGIIVWPWDAVRAVLVPSLSHGYPRQTLTRLPTVAPDANNPVGAAFRSSARQVVAGGGADTSAIVVPLTTPRGCVGVLAIEFVNSLEQDTAVQALATILAAQLSLPVHHVHHVQHAHAEPSSHHAIA